MGYGQGLYEGLQAEVVSAAAATIFGSFLTPDVASKKAMPDLVSD